MGCFHSRRYEAAAAARKAHIPSDPPDHYRRNTFTTDDEPLDISFLKPDMLNQLYRKLMKPISVQGMSMKVGERIVHRWGHMTATRTKIKETRITKELKSLHTMLPLDITNSIFIRYDEANTDYMKAIVTGVEGTPYAHGCFLYDVFFDSGYPNSPPKVNLETNGGETVRFNPNLYMNGYVCLSLLGTWSGRGCEQWSPKSSIQQVLISIQSLVMSENVYGNEPGFESAAATADGKKLNEGYGNIVKYGNIQYAMIDMLKTPPNGFKDVIQTHFFLKKNIILAECKKWIDDAKKTSLACYNGLVTSHNPILAKKLSLDFHKELTLLVAILESELNKLKINIKREMLPSITADCKCKNKDRCTCQANKAIPEEEKMNT
jgi:ubiquitin-protein ligase